MRVTAKKNDGVSPVIGTILLVAITVVLVAIISAVVMGMAGDVGNTHVVGVKVTQGADNVNGTSLLVTITGGDTAGLGNIALYNGSTLVSQRAFTTVGVPLEFSNASSPGKLGSGPASLSIVGQFSDGNQTIYTGKINLV